MSGFRAKDILLVPSLLSLTRIPMAVAFPFVQPSRPGMLVLLGLAGVSDMADGWYARKFDQATPTGAVVDPISDKVFVLSVVVTLVVTHTLPFTSVLLLSTREIGELPLLAWFLVSHEVRHARATKASANVPGKLATAFQFATVAAALLGWPVATELLYVTAGAGVVAAVAYWMRELAAVKTEGAAP